MPYEKRRDIFTMKEIAEQNGIPYNRLWRLVKKYSRVEAPTTIIGYRHYYDTAQAQRVAEQIENLQRKRGEV